MDFDKDKITDVLVKIVNEIHPWYERIDPYVDVYQYKVRLAVNYDLFGYIYDYDVDGILIAEGCRSSVGYRKEVKNIEEGIRFLVEQYFA